MTPRVKRLGLVTAACIVVAALALTVYTHPQSTLGELELLSLDLRAQLGRKTPVNTNLVFVGVDQPGYPDFFGDDEIQATPVLGLLSTNFQSWSRRVWAEAIERLAGAGAKAIALDFVFAAPAIGDDALREAVTRHSNRVVLAANFILDERRDQIAAITTPHPGLLNVPLSDTRRDSRVGIINVVEDRDGVVRSARLQVSPEYVAPSEIVRSFSARIVEKVSPATSIPSDSLPHLFRFTAPPQQGYPFVPFYSLFLPEHWANHGHGAFFRDKIVVIGPAANIFQDLHAVPLKRTMVDEQGMKTFERSMPGPEIHLNVVGALLAGELLREMSPRAGAWITGGGAMLAWLLALMIRGAIRRLLVAVLVSMAFAVAAQLLYDRANFVLAAVGPLLALNGSTLAVFTYDFWLERRERQRTRRTLERYVSKDVVREVLDNPQTYLNTLGGVRKPVTILFSDVRGFTSMSEDADPSQLVTQLNEYFKEMVAIVFREHGSLDKFIGDAVMALWGSITSHGTERDAQHAVAAALAMRRALARLNINWTQRGMQPLAFGIGINHGDAIVGNLGSEEKMEVSVIGDPVNLASRLEGLTKEYKLDLLLGETVASLVQGRFVLRTVDSVKVKGKTRPVRVFTVAADTVAGESAPPWLARYDEGLALYRGRKFAEAADIFAECLREVPDDYLSQLYLNRCRELIANPPGPEWDTVFVMKSK